MLAPDPYNDMVRQYFHEAAHAGDLSRDYAHNLYAEIAESAHGAKVVLAAGVVEDRIVEMRFRVLGCPHLIAGAEALCQDREHGGVAGLGVFDLPDLMTRLAVPVEKTGRILLLEDALNSIWAQYSGSDSAG